MANEVLAPVPLVMSTMALAKPGGGERMGEATDTDTDHGEIKGAVRGSHGNWLVHGLARRIL